MNKVSHSEVTHFSPIDPMRQYLDNFDTVQVEIHAEEDIQDVKLVNHVAQEQYLGKDIKVP